MMVGREVLLEKLEKTGTLGKQKIKTDNIYVADNRGLPAVNGVSFEIREGEILGIAAIEGNGQSELVEAITGLRHIESGHVYIEDKDVTEYTARQIRAAGVAHIPEDRVSTGVSGPSSILENLIIGKERRGQFSIRGIHLRQSSIRRYADDMFKKFDIRGAGVDTRVDSLSGGNMQKVVVAREFSYDTPILVIAQPTRGVDIGAMEFIHDKIVEKRNNGAAILLVSADLDEVFRLSDRIITLYEGKITGEFESGEISKMDIGYYMTGDRRDDND